ncbi:MAG: hypothetical protein ABUT20_48260, partial [Bacteroidota bacterium]
AQNSNRGIKTFNALLFENADDISTTKPEKSNGRNQELLASRDNFLLHRFYYKTKIQRKNYMDVLEDLMNETFISKYQIQKIINNNRDQILLIKKQQPPLKTLCEVWPHIKW